MQLVQINLKAGGGELNSSYGFFTPFQLADKIEVPTLPNITFKFEANDGDMSGIFDMLLFTLKPKATKMTGAEIAQSSCSEIFSLVDLIRHPLILSQSRGNMSWPGDGRGPRYTKCLASPCDRCM